MPTAIADVTNNVAIAGLARDGMGGYF